MSEAERPSLSVIVPVCDEAGGIEAFLGELLEVAGAAMPVEVIVVDDGSRDGSDQIVARMAESDPRIKLVRHTMRGGKSAALRSGAERARALWIGMIDGDGENDPRDLVAMTKEIDLGKVDRVGLVAGNRRRRTAGSSRLIASRIANAIRKTALNDDCPDTACGLKVIPTALFLRLPFFDSLHRFMPALVKRMGYETRNVMVDDRPRMAGQSKYTNLGRALVGIVDLLGVVWLLRRTSVPPISPPDQSA
jgi:dolichol-phosphate mannosyltransferase